MLSVAFVAGYGLIGPPRRWDVFGAVVYAFGLVHGLGLAARLQSLDVPEDGMLWRVIASNVGIEIGQLTAIVGVLGAAALASILCGPHRESLLRTTAYAAMFLVGSAMASALAYRGLTSVDGDARASRRPRTAAARSPAARSTRSSA